jgi:hypothetical protein
MTDEYAKLKARVEEGEGFDEDNWQNTENKKANLACPNNKPFVQFGHLDTGAAMNWWINYHWTVKDGTYDSGRWFRSNFDPKQFFELSNEGLTLRAFGDEQDKCITSELVSRMFPGDNYSFLVTARVDSGDKSFAKLDPNLIFGIFTYQFGNADPSTTPNIHRELDLLEIVSGKWAQKDKTGNAQFTVQPWDKSGNLKRLTIPDTRYLTAWMSRVGPGPTGPTYPVVHYKLFKGDYSQENIGKATPFAEWLVPTPYIPPSTGCARFHINLYLAEGLPPQKEQRITITRIQLLQTQAGGSGAAVPPLTRWNGS